MANSMFSQFKATLKQSLMDEDFRRKNQIYQDEAYLQDALSRIDALTQDITITQDYGDVVSVLGMLLQDPANSAIKFDTKGFATTLSAFREGLISNPRKIWKRDVADSPDRYLLSDRVGGVLVLNDSVEVLYRFPGFGLNLVANEYDDPTACCTFTINSIEYVAIVMQSHHICNIYLYDSPNTFQATIGQIDAPDDIPNYLNTPVGVAVDEANARLYILSQVGQPTGSSLSRGYVSVYDITDPALPVYVSTEMFYASTGSLLDVETDTATDIFYEDSLLWVSNGNSEVGAIDVSVTPFRCAKFIEPAGAGYTLHAPAQVYVHATLGGFKYVFVANGAAGLIERFDQLTLVHQQTYGYRASEDELNSYNRMSDSVYGAIGYSQGVIADRVALGGQETDVMICADPLNKRLHRFNLNTYETDNLVNFGKLTFDVPISVEGWSVSGTIPPDMVKVYYRYKDTEDFRELLQDVALPPTSTIQFRLTVELDSRRFLREWYVKKLKIHGKQA